ncbi:MAG TPA: zf-HC2 domain-containing protein [Pyrinomonadaceae bacterium]|nr:zf-HC2 domain-containing protein [Pyrinomonadaceae bacterium]
MQKINERPVCHRAEDLVTYLYGEATAEEARDFSAHMQQCDACRAEFTVFHQVHDSIVAWRNEALGAPSPASAGVTNPVVVTGAFVQHERKLSALAALREFFSVSPLWLRGATAFAGLLLCALIVFAVSRAWQQPPQFAGNNKKYSEQEFQEAVQKLVAEQAAKSPAAKSPEETPQQVADNNDVQPRMLTTRRSRPKTQPANKLTREEREQLAADLGLIPRREEELPFVLPDGEEPY